MSNAISSNVSTYRSGKMIILLLLLLPTMLAVAALIVDGSDLMGARRRLQQASDAAVLAAATESLRGRNDSQVKAEGLNFAQLHSGFSDLDVQVHLPPAKGKFVGHDDCLSITLTHSKKSHFGNILDGLIARDVSVTSTARLRDTGIPAALVALDPSPELLSITGLPLAIGTSTSLAGLEVEGLGGLHVKGAIHVNNEFGGFDENWKRVGDRHLLRHGIVCIPGLGLEHVRADEIRVVGGVDWPANYSIGDSQNPVLKANRLPVPDPFESVPVPIAGVHAGTDTTQRGGVTVVGLPLITPPVVLWPGVYDWIQIVSGRVIFQPGIYIIRGKNPITQISLAFLAGDIQANNVMFFIQSSSNPNIDDDEEPPYNLGATIPSVLMADGVLNSDLNGLNDPSSPFHGMLLYQQRSDRRPIVIAAHNLLGGNRLSGAIYSKWGHLILAGRGRYELTLVAGSIRVVSIGIVELDPTYPTKSAYDVQLVD